MIFSNYTTESIAIHMAGWNPHWINRDMLFVTFDYPFNQLGVKRIFGYVPETTFTLYVSMRSSASRIVARIEGMFPHNVACCLMKLEREDCRFLGVRPRNIFGQTATRRPRRG